MEKPGGLPGGRSERREAPRTSAPQARKRRPRFSLEERRELLAEFLASGAEPDAFCLVHGMSAATLKKWLRDARGGRGTMGKRTHRRRYTPEEKRQAIEAFAASGRTRRDFARLWGVSESSLSKWLQRYEAEGPKGLEPRKGGGPGAPRLPRPVRDEIADAKRKHPTFGMRRVRDWLRRFRGIKVSAGSVGRTLKEEGLAETPPPARRRPKKKPPRRFERARPGELWQTDITSFVLPRPGRRVYLIVFLDDHSRYVVSWGLHTHQKGEIATEALLDGIARFGKPVEVLSDQGRQYFAWRGKSAFQKLLAKEGIAHVVSRAHHPQTLGKCERLWKTVDEELWSRTGPNDLVEARRRMEHYFAHYNHFRPHQGIDGLVPADRFFGAEAAAREAIEAQHRSNELALALEEEPRKPLFLFGQVGDRAVSMHGERGRVVIQTESGEEEVIALDELGAPDAKERDDGRGVERTGERVDPAAQAAVPQEAAVRDAAETGGAGEGVVGRGDAGGEDGGAPALHGDPGVLDGPHAEGGRRGAPGDAAAARVADLAAGAVGDDCRFVAPAEDARESGALAARPEERPQDAAPPDRGARGGTRAGGEPGACAQGPAVERHGEPWRGGARCSEEEWAAGVADEESIQRARE
jgi:transposase InsO family protein